MKRQHGIGVAALLLVEAALTSGPRSAHADVPNVAPLPATGDGVYGRFDGDVDLGVGLGVRSGPEGYGPALRLTGHYLYMVGLYAEAALPLNDGAAAWTASTGIDLRPLFLPRWALDLQHGPAFLDLLVDSISLALGPFAVGYSDSDEAPSFGVQVDVGAAIPLMAQAHGLWFHVRASGRWSNATADDAPFGVVALLSWQAPWLSPIVD